MPSPRASMRSCLLAAATLILCNSASAHGTPPVNAPFALGALVTSQGPLAISGDGRWRVHVDGANTLHRVGTADRVEAGRVALPIPVATVALTRDGRRAALLTESGCLAIVDFASTASVRWVTGEGASVRGSTTIATSCVADPQQLDAQRQQPEDGFGLRPLAISDDGRLVAARAGVIDLEAGRVIARLPRTRLEEAIPGVMTIEAEDEPAGPLVTQLRFVDGGRRLFALVALLGAPEDHYDNFHADRLQAAVWDLASRRMLRLVDIPTTEDTGTGLVASLDQTTGVIWSVGAAPGKSDGLALMRTPVASCDGSPTFVQAIEPGLTQWVADPRQRWLARLQWSGRDNTGMRTRDGLALRVDGLAGTPLLRAASDRDVLGVVASPDGSTLYGLRMPRASKAWPPVDAFGGDVVEWRLAGLAPAAAAPLAAWPAHACEEAREAHDARELVPVTRGLAPAWERRVPLLEIARRRADPEAFDAARCTETLPADRRQAAFIRRDGNLWLDAFDAYEQLDLVTGRTVAREATVRRSGTCALPLPTADGSVAWSGDTLSWRAFGTGARQPIDVRPGWRVDLVARDAGRLLVQWRPKPGTPEARRVDAVGGPLDMFHDVVYDVHSWKRISDAAGEFDSQSDAPDPALGTYIDRAVRATCQDADGRPRTGWDVEIADDAFTSVRGIECDPARPGGRGRTVMHTGLDLSPGDVLPGAHWRTAVGSSGAIAVVQSGRALRVFDLPHHVELGRLWLRVDETLSAVHVLADSGWIVLDAIDHRGREDELAHVVRAYPVPR